MQDPPHDSVRELAGMLVRVTAGADTFPGAIRERDGKRIRVSTAAPLRLRDTARIALVDTDARFGTVRFGARVASIVASPRGSEVWFELLRVVAAADVAFLARVVEPLIGRTPSSWLAFRREGHWTSYDLDPAAPVALPTPFEAPPAPISDAAGDAAPPVAHEPPRAIPNHLLEDCHACDLPIHLTIAGVSTPRRVHRASRDGHRAFCHITGTPPRLGDPATLRLHAPDPSAAITLPASVGWVDRPSAADGAVEIALILSTRIPRAARESWLQRLRASAPRA